MRKFLPLIVVLSFFGSLTTYAGFDKEPEGAGHFESLPAEVIQHIAAYSGESIGNLSQTSQEMYWFTEEPRRGLREEVLGQKLIWAKTKRESILSGIESLKATQGIMKKTIYKETAAVVWQKVTLGVCFLTRQTSPWSSDEIISLGRLVDDWKKNGRQTAMVKDATKLSEECQLVIVNRLIECIEAELVNHDSALISEIYNLERELVEQMNLTNSLVNKLLAEGHDDDEQG
jgi:hypothetical protein